MQIDIRSEQIAEVGELVAGGHLSVSAVDIDVIGGDFWNLIHSSIWPRAAPQIMIVNNDDKKVRRAKSIIKPLPLIGKKFLDFGCGQGHCVQQATRLATMSIGYDPHPDQWDKLPDCRLTSDLEEVKQYAPYDTILVYDVLDHTTDHQQMMADLAKLSGPNTTIYMRCHPYTSRHATHAYEVLNRAFVHLFLTAEQQAELGLKQDVWQNMRPLNGYNHILRQSPFKHKVTQVQYTPVEKFFSIPALYEHLLTHWQNDKTDQQKDILGIMSMDFIDIELVIK